MFTPTHHSVILSIECQDADAGSVAEHGASISTRRKLRGVAIEQHFCNTNMREPAMFSCKRCNDFQSDQWRDIRNSII